MHAKKGLKLMLGLSLLGWANAFYTLWHRQSLLTGTADGESFCNINSLVNCDAVALSRYSTFLGISVSAWGMVFYSALFVLALWKFFAALDDHKEKIQRGLTLLSAVSVTGLLPTLVLAASSLFLLKNICLFCIFTYLINFALVGVALVLQKRVGTNASFIGSLKSLPTSMWIVFLLISALQLFSPRIIENSMTGGAPQLDENTLALFVSQHFSEKVLPIRVEGSPGYGPTDAKVIIVEFSDFQCPYCAKAAKVVPSIVSQYPKDVRVVFKNYPLDPQCNSGMQGSGHNFACLAAKTGHCVYKLKGDAAFFAYKSSVFRNQEEINASFLREEALARGLNADELDTCVNDYSTHQAIVDQIAEGTALNVQGTPAIFMNGRVFKGGPDARLLKATLDKYLLSP